jgi:hypothetical protein
LFDFSKHSQQRQRVSFNRYLLICLLTLCSDREEALKDDYPLEDSAYDDDDDEEDAWGGDDTTWTEEAEAEDEVDGRDESSAYLEFLNEEVCICS